MKNEKIIEPEIKEILLCPGCLEPFKLNHHYCEICGNTVGKYTAYMPYVNIKHNYRIFGKIVEFFTETFKKLKNEKLEINNSQSK
ncbi:MAG: hypothetical protein HN704_00910 [Bacteroidetes bacterium]|jgi:predicted amidophosphoribosyltransferase|nr:hypothetical protein [Bacteroidota bacterium]MBT6685550.1 hypothetical protein [Bacteroidota bacterium]MBT7142260.1 hypothetical protein [Bacteroidota bacterium]MBT7490144.1 hypothetical protein [Bacteroidota bacterium]